MKAKNSINKNILKKKLITYLKINFKKKFNEVLQEIEEPNKTLNVLNRNFSFNFKTKDIKKFRKFKTIAIIGMGGSILGAEAMYNFLEKKIKKKVYFFNDLNFKKITDFKKVENLNETLIFIISKSGNTIETLSNALILNVINKKSKNVIIISEKKNNFI